MNKAQYRRLAKQLRRVQSGDGAALKEIFDALATPVYYGILRMLRSEREAAALTREVFVDLFADAEAMETTETLMAAAARLTYLHSLRQLRHGGKPYLPAPGGADDLGQFALPSDYADDPEKAALVHRAFNLLDDEERAVALLHYYNGFAVEEIATILGCGTQTAAGQLRRAHGALARLIFGAKEAA